VNPTVAAVHYSSDRPTLPTDAKTRQAAKGIVSNLRGQIATFQLQDEAALRIQRAWRKCRRGSRRILSNAPPLAR